MHDSSFMGLLLFLWIVVAPTVGLMLMRRS